MDKIPIFDAAGVSIADLREQLKQLRKEMEGAAVGSNEYKQALQQVNQTQQTLNSTLEAGKKEATDFEKEWAKNYQAVDLNKKSINQLRAELKTLTRALNDAEPGEMWDELNGKVLAVNNQLKALEQSHGDFRRSVGSYAKVFDDFTQSADAVQKAGNGILGGLSAIAGAMELTTQDNEKLNNAIAQMSAGLKVLNSAKDLPKVIANMKGWLTATKAQTTATKAQSAANGIMASTTQATAAAESAAIAPTTAFATALNLLPFVAIATAVAVLITHFREFALMLESAGEKLGIFHKQELAEENTADSLGKKFEKQNKELELKNRLKKAQGATDKEILATEKALIEQQIADTKAIISNIEARNLQIKADSAWVRFWKRENGELKDNEEEIKKLTELVNDLTEQLKSVNVDIQIAGINEAKAGASSTSNVLNQSTEELRKAAEASAKELQKIHEQQLDEIQKVQASYTAMFKNLEELEKKEKEALTANYKARKKSAQDLQIALNEITEKFASGRAELEIQKAEAVSKAEKAVFDKRMGYVQKYVAYWTNKVKNGGTIDDLRSALGFSEDPRKELRAIENEAMLLKEAFNSLERGILKTNVEVGTQLYRLKDEDIRRLYEELLRDEESFLDRYKEPFTSAIRILGENLEQQAQLSKEFSIEMVNATVKEVNEGIEKLDFKAVNKGISNMGNLLESVFKDKGVNVENTLINYAKDVKKRFYEAFLEAPISSGKGFIEGFGEIKEFSNEIDKLITDHIEHLKEARSEFREGTFEYINFTQQIDEAEKQLAENRKQRDEAYIKHHSNFLNSYGTATSSVLNESAKLWNKLIDIKEAKMKADLDEGKISKREYDAQHKRNEASFKAMKALQLASAVISTAAAVAQALADTTVPNFYVRLANSIAAGIAGATEIATISATELGSATGSAASSFNMTQRTPVVQTTGMNPNDYAEAATQNIRVYVTDKDLADGVNNYKTKVEETSF